MRCSKYMPESAIWQGKRKNQHYIKVQSNRQIPMVPKERKRQMKTIHWLIISILSFNIGYYVGRWVGRSQERGKTIRARLCGDMEDKAQANSD